MSVMAFHEKAGPGGRIFREIAPVDGIHRSEHVYCRCRQNAKFETEACHSLRIPHQVSSCGARYAALDAHACQRIFKLRPAAATYSISSSAEGENPAEVAMVATKYEIQHCHQFPHKPLCSVVSVSLLATLYSRQMGCQTHPEIAC
jgi:hypothetical protein